MEIFIGNLPRYASASHLNRFFAGYGRIAQFHILEQTMADGEVVRFGHGLIEPDIAAQHAIARLNGKRLLGRPLVIRPYRQRSARDRRGGGRRERRGMGELRIGRERRVIDCLHGAHPRW